MLKVIYSNTLSQLAAQLAETHRQQLLSPFEPETIIVQSNELARWLSLFLAQQQGIAANLVFPFPSAYIWQLFRQIWPEVPLQSPYAKDPLTWRLCELLPACRNESGFEAVDAYLGAAADPLKTYELASRIADTFDQYLMYRPDWIRQWEQGSTPHWQAALWHRLTQQDPQPMHRARLLQQLHELLQHGTVPSGSLPTRLSIFGLSTLPPVYLDLFAQMARHCDITVYYLSPSEQFWGDLSSPKQLSRQQLQFDFDEGLLMETHPLLASLGRQGQDFFQQLQEIDPVSETAFIAPQPLQMLGRLQADLLNLDAAEAPWHVDVQDDSIRVQVCHSALREIEVLQDQLLALFEQYPDLSPTDILVMTPDINVYAPWIEAVFGTAEIAQRIPFSIADSQSQAESPLLTAWFALLDLPQSRFEVDSVLTLLECPAIQQRFELDETALAVCRQWCQDTRIRWGFDGQDKANLDLPTSAANTWRAGLDRLLLGYAMPLTETGQPWRLFNDQLAFDGMNSERARQAANLARFVEQLDYWRNRLKTPQTLQDWQTSLNLCLAAFFDVSGLSERQHELELMQIREQLARLVDSAQQADFSQPVSIEVVARWQQTHLDALESTHRFMGHGVTFCGMVPMRSIPFPVICLIGMNDEVFPRRQPQFGFDLLAQHHRRGDRSRREDDRYLFLETLISAQQQLYISYVGASQTDNAAIPPSVLVSDLLDYLNERFVTATGVPVSEQITTHHPLQAFSRRYFQAEPAGLFSYQAQHCPQPSVPPPPAWFAEALPEADDSWRAVSLLQLTQFFQQPTRYVCRERLSVRLALDESELESREPFSLNGLEAWQLRQLLLEAQLRDTPPDSRDDIVRATGMLPQGQIGEQWLKQATGKVDEFVATLHPYLADVTFTAEPFELDLAPFTLAGQLDNLHTQGLLCYRMGKVKGRDLLAAWLAHLVLNLHTLEAVPCQTHLVMEDAIYLFKPVTEAESLLRALLDLYWQGLQSPLAFYPESSLAYARQALGEQPEKAFSAAHRVWQSSDFSVGEQQDPYYQLARPDMPLDADTAFAELALQIYEPLLTHCEVIQT